MKLNGFCIKATFLMLIRSIKGFMKQISSNHTFQYFETIELSELMEKKLLSRFDRKYVIPIDKIESLLDLAKTEYQILKIGEKTEHQYISHYFDTQKYSLYLSHHNKRKVRFKLRTREYIDSQIRFAEIKLKEKNSLTQKFRLNIEQKQNGMKEIHHLMMLYTKELPELIKTISISYKRKTLIHKIIDQRITIDTDICFSENGIEKSMPNLAILEVKYSGAKQNSKTPFSHLIHKFECNFSKYCIGVALLHPDIKQNNFLFTLKKIIKI